MQTTALPRTTPDAFHEGFFVRRLPAVVTGGARLLPAFERWTDEHLCEVLASAKATVRLGNGSRARMRFPDFIGYLSAPETFSTSAGAAYLTDFYLRPAFGEPDGERLADDAGFPLMRGPGPFAEWVSIYAGPGGTGTPMHKDAFSTHTWLAQLRGEKVWRLCAPADLDAERAKQTDAFGAVALGCEVYEAVLGPGDLIVLPPGWWHQVQNTNTTLAVSGNFCSFAQARAALAEVEATPELPYRDFWRDAWTRILTGARPSQTP